MRKGIKWQFFMDGGMVFLGKREKDDITTMIELAKEKVK